MKIEIISYKPVMLLAALGLLCTVGNVTLAAPLQSGSRVNDPIVWEQAETVVKQAQSSQAQPIAQQPIVQPAAEQTFAQPQYVGQQYTQPQYTYSEPISGDCGCQPTSAPVTACGCEAAPAPTGCGCQSKSGGCGCKLFSCCSKNQGCPGDTCTLELDKSKVSKTRFKTEQVSVCVPPVRLPWMKCPPGKSKTRVITKLKKEKYKADSCGYKWKLDEPKEAEAPTPAQPQFYESTPVYDSYIPGENQQITPIETYTPEVNVPAVKAIGPVVTPTLTPEINIPKPPASGAAPPPPTTGALPWRVKSPTG